MESNRDAAISLVLKEEGGYTNHPSDPGGPTNFGITIFDARMYLNHDLSAKAPWTQSDLTFMKNMTKEQAIEIYRGKYWAKVRGDELAAGLDYTMVDYAVNSGVGRAIPVLQRILGIVDDGKFGPATLAAVQEHDAKELIASINNERLAFLKRLRTWPTFGKGWSARVARVKATSLQMASA